MKIPDKVKIGWRTYEVEQDEHRSADNGGDLYGEIKYEEGKIYLYDKQSEENKNVTLLHEIIHGIFFMTGHSDYRTNEDLITLLSENLYQVLKDNNLYFGDDSREVQNG